MKLATIRSLSIPVNSSAQDLKGAKCFQRADLPYAIYPRDTWVSQALIRYSPASQCTGQFDRSMTQSSEPSLGLRRTAVLQADAGSAP